MHTAQFHREAILAANKKGFGHTK